MVICSHVAAESRTGVIWGRCKCVVWVHVIDCGEWCVKCVGCLREAFVLIFRCECLMRCAVSQTTTGSTVNTTDILSVCPAGSFSIVGTALCTPCAPGTFNPLTGQSGCSCCAPGTFANASGMLHCIACTNSTACSQPCTIIPDCDCINPANCDLRGCPPGCYSSNDTSVCQRAPAGRYAPCGSSNCSASSNVLDLCPKGTSSLSIGAPSNSTCKACPAGSFCPNAGEVNPQLCEPGTYSPSVGATLCTPCTVGKYSSGPGSSSCGSCSAGTYCLAGASQQCRCPINSYAPLPGGASACTPCLGQAVPATGQSECVAEVAVTGSALTLYKGIIGIF
ncbi:hypothetical protein C9890_0168, partial [Perkinsus sp. BL_2016]